MSTTIAELDRWGVVPALVVEAAARLRQYAPTAWFQIGDAYLEVASDYDVLIRELEALYGDCGIPSPPPGTAHIRCTASVLPGLPLLSLSFDGPRLPDLLEVARSPYRFLLRQCYVESPGPISGWRQLVNTDAGNRLLVASNGRTAVINIDEAPPEFAVDCIFGVVQSVQAGVLFLHAASVGVEGVGALLIAFTRGGKSTMALTLAGRGHVFLGDDVAAVRLSTQELLPFPKSAGLRDGPLARLLDERVRACRHVRAVNRHGEARLLVRVSDLFPSAMGGPLPLRFAFLFDGFADRATINPFRPQLAELKRLHPLVTEASSAWGLSPGRDLMNFLVVVNLLSRLRCHVVKHGSPEETASLIEAAMEKSGIST
jgi:hypothetical protein